MTYYVSYQRRSKLTWLLRVLQLSLRNTGMMQTQLLLKKIIRLTIETGSLTGTQVAVLSNLPSFIPVNLKPWSHFWISFWRSYLGIRHTTWLQRVSLESCIRIRWWSFSTAEWKSVRITPEVRPTTPPSLQSIDRGSRHLCGLLMHLRCMVGWQWLANKSPSLLASLLPTNGSQWVEPAVKVNGCIC